MKEEVQNMNKEEFRKFLVDKANEIVDGVVDRTLDDIADKVMAEKEVDAAMEGEGEEDHEKEISIDKNKEALRGIRAEAAIPDAILSPTRCSPHLMRSVDEHAMTKAERRAAEKNLERVQGHIQRNLLG
jgi:hypothetical protein